MKQFKQTLKSIPLINIIARNLYFRWLELKNPEAIFTEIYKTNEWDSQESISGIGSQTDRTQIIIKELPILFKEFNITTVLDAPCGDFNWMKNVNLRGLNYTGGDIVKEIVKNNQKKYTQDNIDFQHLNLINDPLPKVDLILCRDCFIHFSSADIFLALENIFRSESKFLLTTTYTGIEENHDIVTGRWRSLNLEIAPFFFPQPLKLINEGYEESKALGLWRIRDLQEMLAKTRI